MMAERRAFPAVLDLGHCETAETTELKGTLLPQLVSCGAAYLGGHGVPVGVLKRALAICALIHAVDKESKEMLDVSRSQGARGYFSVRDDGSKAPRAQRREYSSFEVGGELSDATDIESTILFAENVWPAGLGSEVAISEYIAVMWNLARRIFALFERLLDLPPNYFAFRSRHPVFQLRLLEYICRPGGKSGNERQLGLGAHTDYEAFTIILESAPGLQVMARNGSWVFIEPPEGSLVLLVGDLMEVVSGGVLESALHQVVLPVGIRHSCTFFVGLDREADIAPAGGSSFRVGNHLLARALENFPHLRARVESGEIVRPEGFGAGNPFKIAKLGRAEG